MAYRDGAAPGASGVCPGCGAGLRAEVVGGNRLEVCGTCAGVWVPEAELQELKIDPVRQRAVRDWQRGRLRVPPVAAPGCCPRCEAALERRRIGAAEVVVDVCGRHGAWMAPGELGALVELIAARAARGPDPNLRPGALGPDDVAGYLRADRGGWFERLIDALTRRR